MPFLTKFRKSKKLKSPLDFSGIATDMHSHLIPNLDDGSQSLDESLEIIKAMNEMGFKKLITTPHIMSDFFKNTTNSISTGLAILKKEVAKEKIPVEIHAAAEYLLDETILERINNEKLLTFGDNFLLVELSYLSPIQNLKELIFQLQVAGYKIILAHPERCSYWFGNQTIFEELKDRQVYFQINTISLTGFYGPQVRKKAEWLIDQGMVEFIGSDMHNNTYLDEFQKSRFEPYLEKLLASGKLLNSEL